MHIKSKAAVASGLSGSLGFLLLGRYLLDIRSKKRDTPFDLFSLCLGFCIGYISHDDRRTGQQSRSKSVSSWIVASLVLMNYLTYRYF